MYSSSPSNRARESLGSRSKLKRKSRVIQALLKFSRRFAGLFGRESSLLTVLFMLTFMLHFRPEVYSWFANDSMLSAPLKDGHLDGDTRRGSSQGTGPPSYLPLAQHLKNINVTENKPSLQDMVFGIQRRSQSDLKPTVNKDLDKCGKCSGTAEQILKSKIFSKKQLKLAEALLKVISFYDVSSIATIPCSEEANWIFVLTKATRVAYPYFEHHCVVSEDSLALDMIKTYGPESLEGTRFVTYKPHLQGRLPKVDMMFSWRGLEHNSLDYIFQVFKDIVSTGITYTLVGNSPGLANARMVETSKGVFSVVRPELRTLNVRAFPFGFNKAGRVIPVLGKQLLLYNTTDIRETW